MNTLKTSAVGIGLVLATGLLAQDATKTLNTPLVTDVYFPVGLYIGGQALMTTGDWRNLLPNSELLDRDLTWDNGGDRIYGNFIEAGANIEAAIGLDLGRKKGADARFDKQLRVGVSYLSTGYRGRNWYRDNTARYDTLTSSITGQQTFVDTSWNEQYRANYYFSRIGLNAAYILRKRTPNKWSWYVGVGGMVGTTLNASANVKHEIFTSVRSSSSSDYPELNTSQRDVEYEEFRIGNVAWGAAYAIVGIDFRLGKNHPFWSSIHLFDEMRPTVLFSVVPGSASSSNGAWQNLFGLRLDLR